MIPTHWLSTRKLYYANTRQWLPTRRLVAPRSLKDELRPLYANNNPAQPALRRIDCELRPQMANLARRRLRLAESLRPPRHQHGDESWSRRLLSDAPRPHSRPHSYGRTTGEAHGQKLKQRGSRRRKSRNLVYYPSRKHGVRLLPYCRPHRTRPLSPAEYRSHRRPNMRLRAWLPHPWLV